MDYLVLKSIAVKDQIENEIGNLNESELNTFYSNALKDKRAVSFINFYNKTVLDKENINFGEFKHQWAIQGMRKSFYQNFEDNFEDRKQEILAEKDIKNFFNKYCRTERNEASFCCKLFHTILPNDFPPLDNPIRKHFKLNNIDFIDSLLIIKNAYELFIKNDKSLLPTIRKILLEPNFKIFRISELSDFRILDMYYWLKISRNKDK